MGFASSHILYYIVIADLASRRLMSWVTMLAQAVTLYLCVCALCSKNEKSSLLLLYFHGSGAGTPLCLTDTRVRAEILPAAFFQVKLGKLRESRLVSGCKLV